MTKVVLRAQFLNTKIAKTDKWTILPNVFYNLSVVIWNIQEENH